MDYAFGKYLLLAVLLTLAAGGAQGCKTVAVNEQRLLSKPTMTFSDSFTYSYQPRLTVQVEPGSASSGGAQAAGCTSCK